MTAADYVGIAGLITSAAAAVVSIIVALRQTQTHAALGDVQQAVKTVNGHTIGEIIEANDTSGISDRPAPEVIP